jgi:hypothetical protein
LLYSRWFEHIPRIIEQIASRSGFGQPIRVIKKIDDDLACYHILAQATDKELRQVLIRTWPGVATTFDFIQRHSSIIRTTLVLNVPDARTISGVPI